jgi:hypothetical protein
MPSKTKEARTEQRVHWKGELDRRLSELTGKGVEPEKISQDATVRKIRAKLRETNARLNRIASLEEKLKEMARIKAEKAAAPKEDKKDKKKIEAEKSTETSKRQQKKQKKKQQPEG